MQFEISKICFILEKRSLKASEDEVNKGGSVAYQFDRTINSKVMGSILSLSQKHFVFLTQTRNELVRNQEVASQVPGRFAPKPFPPLVVSPPSRFPPGRFPPGRFATLSRFNPLVVSSLVVSPPKNLKLNCTNELHFYEF